MRKIRATAIDLLAGAGGFTAGARAAAVDVIFGLNHWDVAIAAHKKNFPRTLSGDTFTHLQEDAYFYDWNDAPLTDFILASPACQGHSRAATKGLEKGRRGTAPHHDKIRAVANSVPIVASYKAADAIGAGRHPPVVVVENVPDFLNWSGYRGWRQQLQDAAEHDTYHVSEFVVNAADLGVPQIRNRAFVIAVPRTMSKVPFDLQVPKLPPAKQTPFGVCVAKRAGNWVPLNRWPKQSVAQKALIRQAWFKKNGVKEPELWAWQNADTNKPTLMTEPIRTITAKSANQWYLVRNTPEGPVMRSFLVDEYRAAMAFPEDYELPAAIGIAGKLLGNAVCPPVATAILDQLLRRL